VIRVKAKKIVFYFIMFIIFSLYISGIAYTAGSEFIDDMSFKNADIRDVLRSIAEIADLNLISDGSIEGLVTLHLKDISFQDALTLITQSQGLYYYRDGNTIVVASPERIEELYVKKICSNIIINYSDINSMKEIINGIYPDLNIQIDERNMQLIIVGREKEVNEVKKLIEQLDIPDKSIQEVYRLKHLDIDYLINNIGIIYPDVKIIPDKLNKQVLFSGKREDVREVLDLLNKLDTPVKKITRVVSIKEADLLDIERIIRGLYPDIRIQSDETNNQLILTTNEKLMKELVEFINTMDKKIIEAAEIIGINYGDINNILSISSELYPEIQFKLNEIKKELIIYGRKDRVKEAINLIKRLDTPRRQVIIEARIEEISRTELLNIGVLPGELSHIRFISGDNKILEGIELSWPEYLKVLEDKGEAQTLANPRLLTLNGENGKLLIGDRIPVEVEEVVEGQAVKRIEYIDAGISLEFKPWISSDNNITLEVNPRVSSIGESVGGSLPAINTREASTKIRLNDGETFAIGGLIQDDMIESVSKVPLLSDIPILGEIFKHEKHNNIRTEVIIFITPYIVKEDFSYLDEDKKGEESSNNSICNQECNKDKPVEIHGLNRDEIEEILNKEDE
jgi:general secretion pathway protein D